MLANRESCSVKVARKERGTRGLKLGRLSLHGASTSGSIKQLGVEGHKKKRSTPKPLTAGSVILLQNLKAYLLDNGVEEKHHQNWGAECSSNFRGTLEGTQESL